MEARHLVGNLHTVEAMPARTSMEAVVAPTNMVVLAVVFLTVVQAAGVVAVATVVLDRAQPKRLTLPTVKMTEHLQAWAAQVLLNNQRVTGAVSRPTSHPSQSQVRITPHQTLVVASQVINNPNCNNHRTQIHR